MPAGGLKRLVGLLGLVALLTGCVDQGANRTAGPPPATVVTSADAPCVPTSHGCIAVNPDVTPATIDTTICVSGYTKSVRPGTAYTNGVKAKLLREAGLSPDRKVDYELDHIIPLAVGGHPRKLSNLMLQPWAGANGAKVKDVLEVKLQHLVCRHRMDLGEAQRCIAEDWQACAEKLPADKPRKRHRALR
jgi:hypothetical protein